MRVRIPVITVHQPWASLIIEGYKTIETRTHDRFKCLVGKRIGIHASKQIRCCAASVRSNLGYYPRFEPIHGCILGTAWVADFRSLREEDHWKALLHEKECRGRYGLFLTDIKKFDNPIPAKGQQGIWYYEIA
jgi:hypothetical protein